MDSIKETLNEPAAVLTKSDYTIAGKLEAAIRASNAQYDDPKARVAPSLPFSGCPLPSCGSAPVPCCLSGPISATAAAAHRSSTASG